MNRKVKFPFTITFTNEEPKVRARIRKNKYMCDGLNLEHYVPEELIEYASNIVVLGNTGLTWYKGVKKLTPKSEWYKVNVPIEDTSHKYKNLFITKVPDFTWWFNDLTSSYQKSKGQHYVKVELEELAGELDVLCLANDLSMTYGTQFKLHTVSEVRGIYHLTVSDNVSLKVFEDIQKHKDEIYELYGLDIECRAHSTEGKGENKMPVALSEWEW